MENQEFSGKSIEEAIQNAERQLGLSREQFNITILKEARTGILGLGGGEAKIRVEMPDEEEDETEGPMPGNIAPKLESSGVARIAREMVEDLLGIMEIEATVTEVTVEANEEDEAPITFNITGDDVGILIGRHGQTLASLQYMLRVMVAQQTKSWTHIVLDIDGYKERRYAALRATAQRLAEQVSSRRVPFTLEPMPANERRIIHLTLANHPAVTTQSTGEGEYRKVVIYPRQSR